MKEDIKYKLILLKNSLVELSKPDEGQVKFFPEYDDLIDGVISDFEDAFVLLPLIMEEKAISYDAVKEILMCFNIITIIIVNFEKITNESFPTSDLWNSVRQHAKNALQLIN